MAYRGRIKMEHMSTNNGYYRFQSGFGIDYKLNYSEIIDRTITDRHQMKKSYDVQVSILI